MLSGPLLEGYRQPVRVTKLEQPRAPGSGLWNRRLDVEEIADFVDILDVDDKTDTVE